MVRGGGCSGEAETIGGGRPLKVGEGRQEAPEGGGRGQEAPDGGRDGRRPLKVGEERQETPDGGEEG